MLRTGFAFLLALLVGSALAAPMYCLDTDFSKVRADRCTDAVVMLGGASITGVFDWSFLNSLVIIGRNATIVGSGHRYPTGTFVASEVHFVGTLAAPEVFESSDVLRNAAFEGCTWVGVPFGTVKTHAGGNLLLRYNNFKTA